VKTCGLNAFDLGTMGSSLAWCLWRVTEATWLRRPSERMVAPETGLIKDEGNQNGTVPEAQVYGIRLKKAGVRDATGCIQLTSTNALVSS
jgi:hypothetical protein